MCGKDYTVVLLDNGELRYVMVYIIVIIIIIIIIVIIIPLCFWITVNGGMLWFI